jgi:flagellar hook-associated protein 3 FlgL
VQVNVVAKDVLGDGQASGDGLLLDTLRDVTQHLRGGTTADMDALRTTDLKSLSTNLDNLSKVRATVGATTNRLETADARLQEVEESTTKLLSDVEDADMAKTMVDYSTQQSVYKSALQSGANIVQSSLLDFLR